MLLIKHNNYWDAENLIHKPFDLNSAKKAGEKYKRGPAKKERPSIKEKMELVYEKGVG